MFQSHQPWERKCAERVSDRLSVWLCMFQCIIILWESHSDIVSPTSLTKCWNIARVIVTSQTGKLKAQETTAYIGTRYTVRPRTRHLMNS